MTRLLPRAFLVTPNIPEAETLAGMKIETETEMQKAADKLIELGCRAVLIKGGHKSGDPVDIFVAPEGRQRFAGRRIETRHTHGTGCSYSAAITANLARSMDLLTAISNAKAFIEEAISTAPGLGHGYGPVNHFAKLLSEA